MLKTHTKYINLFFCVVLLFTVTTVVGQETILSPRPLIPYLQQLEKRFDIKFSFVDEDIRLLQINIPENDNLDEILANIQDQTQLKLKKLDNRYYSLFKSTTVDICGQVLDNFESPVNVSTIEVLGSTIAITSDIDGQFSLENIPSKATVRIKHLGYKTQYISADELTNHNPCKKLLLRPNYQELDEVVVVQFLTTGLSKQKDASIVLNTKDFGILPGLIEPDVLQTIQALPGVKSIDETVSDINIRGGTNDQNLILWDGIKMYQSGHFFGLISAFNPYLTDKVTLIKNGTSAQYGDGVSGVMSLETNNEIKNTAFGGVGFNLINGDVYGQFPIAKKLAFQFSARRSVTDFLNTPTYSQFIDRAFQDSEINGQSNTPVDVNILRDETFFFYDFTGKLLYDINPDQKIRLSFININNNLDYIESAENSGRTTQSKLDQTNFSIGGSIDSKWNSNFSSFLNVYYTRYNLEAQNISANANQQLFQNNLVLESAVKLNTNYRLSNTLNWLNGYQFNEVGITNITDVTLPAFKSKVKDVIRTHTLFSEANYSSTNKRLNARGGIRINAIENINNTFSDFLIEPRININYEFSKNIHAELLGEFKSQTTNQIIDLKQNFLGIEKRRWTLADGDSIPITQSKQISLGFNYDTHNLYVGLEGFYKKVDGISTATQGFQNQDQFNGEIGSYDIRGIEFLINKKTKTFSTWLSYAYNVNNYTFEDIIPNQFPNNLDITHTATFAATYTHKKIKLGFGINYRTGKPYTKPLVRDIDAINTINFPNTINYQEPNSSRLPDYLRADASAIYTFYINSKIKASAGASIINVLSKKNILNTYYRLNDDNEIETIESLSLGITPNVSFRVSF